MIGRLGIKFCPILDNFGKKLLIAGLITLTIVTGSNVLVPLLVSFALAFMLEPLAGWFQRRGRSRSVAVLLTLGSAILRALLLLFLLPGIYHQIIESVEKLPLALRAVAAPARSGGHCLDSPGGG
jgi:predicted PurR-regulated permease PerM